MQFQDGKMTAIHAMFMELRLVSDRAVGTKRHRARERERETDIQVCHIDRLRDGYLFD